MLSYRKGAARTAVILVSSVAVAGSVLIGAGPAAATASLCSVSALSATKGSTAGGTNTLITGKGFLNVDETVAAAVKFGSANATSFLVLSDTQIAAKAPAGTGTVDVTVADTATNASAVVAGDKFTYLAPITVTVPSSTLLNSLGGSVVTVTSAGGSPVSFGASQTAFTALKITATVNGAAATLKWASSTTATMTVPAGTPSSTAVKVMLYNDSVAGTADTTNAKYAAVITKVSTVSGVVGGGGTVTVTGKGFTGATAWKFGTVSATCTPASTGLSASCTVPAASAAGAVSVNFTPASSAPYATTAGATYTYTDVS